MCLTHVYKTSHDEDIIVYKIVEEQEGNFVSPFYPFFWRVGRTYRTHCTNPDIVRDHLGFIVQINGGCFHTFEFLEEAKDELEAHRHRWTKYKSFLAKCRIPKDSNFVYKGNYIGIGFNYYCSSYASEKLEILEILPD